MIPSMVEIIALDEVQTGDLSKAPGLKHGLEVPLALVP